MMIRAILNKIRWDTRLKAEDYFITFVHRGGEDNKKIISCASINSIEMSAFSYKEGSEDIIIPFHRILKIENIKNGKIVWQKKA
jgi:uncharacterized protein (UPF0248 family)